MSTRHKHSNQSVSPVVGIPLITTLEKSYGVTKYVLIKYIIKSIT